MADDMDKKVGEITIKVTEDSFEYNSDDFNLVELMFWLEVVKTTIMKQLTEMDNVG